MYSIGHTIKVSQFFMANSVFYYKYTRVVSYLTTFYIVYPGELFALGEPFAEDCVIGLSWIFIVL